MELFTEIDSEKQRNRETISHHKQKAQTDNLTCSVMQEKCSCEHNKREKAAYPRIHVASLTITISSHDRLW